MNTVAIVGAGPAGTAAAIHLGQLGVRDVVLVDRYDFPRDKTCGSGISPKGIQTLKTLGVWEQVAAEAYKIKGLRLVLPGGHEVFASGGEEAAAIICCRRRFDHLLLQRALALGVRFIPNFDTRELIYDGGRVTGFKDRDGRTIYSRYTVIANGAHSTFTVNSQPRRLIQAVMGWWENVPFESHHIEMIFDRMVTPYYGWLFPENQTRVNIGICYEDEGHTQNARTLFQQFLRKHYTTRLAGAVQVGDWKGHPISYSYRIGQLHSPGRLVIGEAGRMTHPATAEGIYQGMHSGILAAEALRDALGQSVEEKKAMSEYEARCRKAFQVSFWSAKLWRRAVQSPLLDVIAGFSQKPMVKTALAKLMSQM